MELVLLPNFVYKYTNGLTRSTTQKRSTLDRYEVDVIDATAVVPSQRRMVVRNFPLGWATSQKQPNSEYTSRGASNFQNIRGPMEPAEACTSMPESVPIHCNTTPQKVGDTHLFRVYNPRKQDFEYVLIRKDAMSLNDVNQFKEVDSKLAGSTRSYASLNANVKTTPNVSTKSAEKTQSFIERYNFPKSLTVMSVKSARRDPQHQQLGLELNANQPRHATAEPISSNFTQRYANVGLYTFNQHCVRTNLNSGASIRGSYEGTSSSLFIKQNPYVGNSKNSCGNPSTSYLTQYSTDIDSSFLSNQKDLAAAPEVFNEDLQVSNSRNEPVQFHDSSCVWPENITYAHLLPQKRQHPEDNTRPPPMKELFAEHNYSSSKNQMPSHGILNTSSQVNIGQLPIENYSRSTYYSNTTTSQSSSSVGLSLQGTVTSSTQLLQKSESSLQYQSESRKRKLDESKPSSEETCNDTGEYIISTYEEDRVDDELLHDSNLLESQIDSCRLFDISDEGDIEFITKPTEKGERKSDSAACQDVSDPSDISSDELQICFDYSDEEAEKKMEKQCKVGVVLKKKKTGYKSSLL